MHWDHNFLCSDHLIHLTEAGFWALELVEPFSIIALHLVKLFLIIVFDILNLPILFSCFVHDLGFLKASSDGIL